MIYCNGFSPSAGGLTAVLAVLPTAPTCGCTASPREAAVRRPVLPRGLSGSQNVPDSTAIPPSGAGATVNASWRSSPESIRS